MAEICRFWPQFHYGVYNEGYNGIRYFGATQDSQTYLGQIIVEAAMIKVGVALRHGDQAQFQFITNPVISQSFNYTQTVTGFRLSSAGFRPAVTNLNESLTIL